MEDGVNGEISGPLQGHTHIFTHMHTHTHTHTHTGGEKMLYRTQTSDDTLREM